MGPGNGRAREVIQNLIAARRARFKAPDDPPPRADGSSLSR